MSEYLIQGRSVNHPERHLHLELPVARKHTFVKVGDEETSKDPCILILSAVRTGRRSDHMFRQNPPVVQNAYGPVNFRNALQRILSKHPYPFLQGPSLVSVEHLLLSTEKEVTETEVLENKTLFSHSENQNCYKWSAEKSGLHNWGISKNGDETEYYEISDHQGINLFGPATSKDTKQSLYTCKFHKCIVLCPCTICSDPSKSCNEDFSLMNCSKCKYQCQEHKVKLSWTFNHKEDHSTLIVSNSDFYHFAIPYAGIPLSCTSCSEDVLEHQIFHLTVHLKCKFCRQDFKPFENQLVSSSTDIVQCQQEVRDKEDVTCSTCFRKSLDVASRIRHEKRSHGSFSCRKCDSTFSSQAKLKYHCKTVHTTESMKKSKLQISDNSKKYGPFICDDCGSKFKHHSHLLRHTREVHLHTDFNLDYLSTDSLVFACSFCASTFKRKSDVRRHENAVHTKQSDWICSNCGAIFTRKDNFMRHSRKSTCKNVL